MPPGFCCLSSNESFLFGELVHSSDGALRVDASHAVGGEPKPTGVEFLKIIDVSIMCCAHEAADARVLNRGRIQSRVEPNVLKKSTPLVGRSAAEPNLIHKPLYAQRIELPFDFV